MKGGRKLSPFLIRWAAILLLLIAILSMAATLVPQRQPDEVYASRYGGTLASLLRFFSFDDFFRSAVFFILIGALFVDLTACSAIRVVTRLRARAPKRFGPDVVHLGLLLAIIAGVLSSVTREETSFSLKPGESMLLPNAQAISLVSFDFRRYPDGRPADWISRLRVAGDNATTEHEIEVNRPLTLGGVTLYQSSYREFSSALLATASGKIELEKNEGIETADGTFVFLGPGDREGSALFARLTKSGDITERMTIFTGENVGAMTVERISASYATGLQAVRDPFSWLVILSLVVAAGGLALTLAQKIKEKR